MGLRAAFPPSRPRQRHLHIRLHSSQFLEKFAIESSSPGQGATVRLVLIRIEPNTTDVSGFKSLVGVAFQPLSLEVLLELPIPLQGLLLDNIEAIAWGPVLANGNRSLILTSDNNFSRLQATQFLALEVVSR